MELFWVQRRPAWKTVVLTVNIKESVMEGLAVIELGRASTDTREPVYPPIWFDGVSFQFFRPFWPLP
jgi:hypothetical protein